MSGLADIFASPGPRWFSIPSGRCFLDDLARGLCEALGNELPSAQILTPTRRGARAMARSFTSLARGGALLLPQIRAIGDLDEGEPPFDLDSLDLDLPPALSALRRRFELARLISDHYADYGGRPVSARLALELADSLAGFFDSLALEEVDATGRLDGLVSGTGEDQYRLESMAEHWQISARFLRLAVEAWPKRLRELGMMDPGQRQVVLIRKLIDQWTEHPPQIPLVLAGSTGSAPSMADLMNLTANAPKGAVVLPGLDLSLAADVWAQIGESHPQGTMKRLLDRHHVDRSVVRSWPASMEKGRRAEHRRRLLNEALRPAEATKDWLAQIATLQAEDRDTIADGLNGLCEIVAGRDEEAASVIALLMRETLETPGKVCALVTPDQALARRVSARLSRWGLQADSSAGEPLANSLSGRFLLTVLSLMRTPHDAVGLLEIFNHPFSYFSGKNGLFFIEKYALRGAPPNDLAGITAMLEAVADDRRDEDGMALWSYYASTIASYLEISADLGEAVRCFTALAQAMSQDGGATLWAGAAGTEASELLSELIREGAGFTISGVREFSDIVTHLIRSAKVRTGGNTHPRLLVLGAIEARLVKADRLILAGLEEGVWPQAPDIDPFLSRPMRETLGLPPPERRTGLSAHDFVQSAAAPEAFLITRQRREGEPQVQSRWLWRLQTLCKGAGFELPQAKRYLDWARAMDCGLAVKPPELKPAPRPEPKPPVAARPMVMSVTEVELFVRDPYAVYARRILGLRPLDRPNEPVEARQRGIAIHRSLERFVIEDVPLGEAGAARLTALLEDELAATHLSPAQMAQQRPLLPGMAQAFVAFERDRRALRPRLLIEAAGEMTLATPGGDFTLRARADRLEVREGAVDILDFKTGGHASVKQVLSGFYPQLTLTAAIVRHGGFADVRALSIGDLLYVRLSSDVAKALFIRDKVTATDDLAEQALARFRSRIIAYQSPDKGYRSWTAPQFLKGRGGDYDQLARLYEWYVLGDDEAAEDDEAAA